MAAYMFYRHAANIRFLFKIKPLQSQAMTRIRPMIKSVRRRRRREKTKYEYDKSYDAKRKRLFVESWLIDFPWLENVAGVCKCKLCKKFPLLADKSSGLFNRQPG
jgi:hypothetical protein